MSSKKKNFYLRTFSTLLLWALVIGILVSRIPILIIGLLIFFHLIGSIEYNRLFKKNTSCINRSFLIFFIATFSSSIIIWKALNYGYNTAYIFTISSFIFIFIFYSFLILGKNNKSDKERLNEFLYLILGFIYVGFLFSFTGKLVFSNFSSFSSITNLETSVRNIEYLFHRQKLDGTIYLFFVILVSKITDCAAYLVGSLIGKNKAVPHISPKKTWEGFIGGGIIGISSGILCYLFFKDQMQIFNLTEIIIISTLLSLLAIVGDLFESIIKRAQDIKDAGSVLPGIGGILDLIDSLCFTIPVFYLLLIFKSQSFF